MYDASDPTEATLTEATASETEQNQEAQQTRQPVLPVAASQHPAAPQPPAAKASIATVDTLFHNMIYEIPSYQREFTWETKQVEALLGDLLEAFESRIALSNQPQYFLGAIVTQERQFDENGETEIADKIVDGQQRITSLLLILAVLCKHLARREADTDTTGIWEEAQQKLLTLIYRPNAEHFVLNVSGYNYYLRQLLGGKAPLPQKLSGQPPFKTTALQKLIKAFKLFEHGLLVEIGGLDPEEVGKAEPNRHALAHFANWLVDGVFLALIADTDPYDDQRLFDRMNTRGLPLSEGERFKSRVLSAANVASSERASRLWQKNQDFAVLALNSAGQSGSLAVRDSREAERRLMGGWLIAAHLDLKEVNASTIRLAKRITLDPYDYCLSELMKEDGNKGAPLLFSHLKAKFFSFVQRVKRKKAYGGVYAFQPGLSGLQHAQIMKLPFLDAAISACFLTSPAGQANKRLRILAAFLDLLAFQRAWNRHWATNARLERLVLSAIEIIKRTPHKELRHTLYPLLANLPHIEASNAPGLVPTNQRWIRYFLGRAAHFVERQATGRSAPTEFIDGKGNRAPEIEHIFSKRYNDDGSAFGFHRDEIEAYRQRLGALTLLAREDNRAASNRSWQARTEIYAKSNLLTRTLLADTYDNQLRLKEADQALSSFRFEPWDKITPDAIERRETAYANLAREIWSKADFLAGS